MEPGEASALTPGTAVWIWIVRQGEGRWWPGTVQRLAARDGAANVTVRFECSPLPRGNSRATSFVGISTTQLRYLERRTVSRKGTDRPRLKEYSPGAPR